MQSIKILDWVEQLRAKIVTLWDERPEQAYIIGNQLKKLWDEMMNGYNEKFRNYYDENKELPWGFSCKISSRSTLSFDENDLWRKIKGDLDLVEKLLKQATEDPKHEVFHPETGEILKPVSKKSSEIYSLSRK